MWQRFLIFISRWANGLTGGSRHELLCTRAYRNDWRWVVAVIDGAFYVCGSGHKRHCRRSYIWDRHVNGRPK